jgi:hypothetical protein
MTEGETTRKQAFKDASEDMLGFGGVEVRTARDLLVRPRLVLQAWMIEGPTGGGVYAKPLKLYLALNAILMLFIFLRGGLSFYLEGVPAEIMGPLLQEAGKSREAFLADADGWMSLVTVPIMAPFYALAAMPLFRLWDAEDLGLRRGFRASFAYLNAWTVPMLPLAWFMFSTGPLATACSLIMIVLGFVAFMRMGRGRWYRGVLPGLGKALILVGAIGLSSVVSTSIVMVIGLVAGLAT